MGKTTAGPDAVSAPMARILLLDAVWDVLLGAATCSVPFWAEPLPGVRLMPWWPLFFILGIGCIGFGVVMARAALSIRPRAKSVCTTAAIANGLGAGLLMAIVALVPGLDRLTNSTLLVVALVCGGFAFLEWRQVRP